MRLWHKDLVKILPTQQLTSQWRECCCIAKNISTNGTPNHLLVNKIMDYPVNHFIKYTNLVVSEMKKSFIITYFLMASLLDMISKGSKRKQT